ncbi:MAG TPA: carboxypeptidase-like regulatory domain-containing protein [Gemmatimonadaceae bacterium]|nr:carboxypeptidase-like regulatory domain-containing protein [Gemmatimonadaceae bacterium]
MSLRKLHIGLAAATVMFLLGGCRTIEGPVSSFFGDECQETENPASFGCVDIQGAVTNSSGHPLSGVDIALIESGTGLGPDFVVSDQAGEYELRLLAVESRTQVNMTLKATLRRNDGSEITSVLTPVVVTVTQIGEVPEPVTVNFIIPGT